MRHYTMLFLAVLIAVILTVWLNVSLWPYNEIETTSDTVQCLYTIESNDALGLQVIESFDSCDNLRHNLVLNSVESFDHDNGIVVTVYTTQVFKLHF